jgi:hypothetical protein
MASLNASPRASSRLSQRRPSSPRSCPGSASSCRVRGRGRRTSPRSPEALVAHGGDLHHRAVLQRGRDRCHTTVGKEHSRYGFIGAMKDVSMPHGYRLQVGPETREVRIRQRREQSVLRPQGLLVGRRLVFWQDAAPLEGFSEWTALVAQRGATAQKSSEGRRYDGTRPRNCLLPDNCRTKADFEIGLPNFRGLGTAGWTTFRQWRASVAPTRLSQSQLATPWTWPCDRCRDRMIHRGRLERS